MLSQMQPYKLMLFSHCSLQPQKWCITTYRKSSKHGSGPRQCSWQWTRISWQNSDIKGSIQDVDEGLTHPGRIQTLSGQENQNSAGIKTGRLCEEQEQNLCRTGLSEENKLEGKRGLAAERHRKGYLTKFTEKAKVGNAFFTLVSIVKLIFRSPRPLNLLGKPGAKKTFHQYRMNKLGKIRYVHLLYFNFVKVRGGACLWDELNSLIFWLKNWTQKRREWTLLSKSKQVRCLGTGI